MFASIITSGCGSHENMPCRHSMVGSLNDPGLFQLWNPSPLDYIILQCITDTNLGRDRTPLPAAFGSSTLMALRHSPHTAQQCRMLSTYRFPTFLPSELEFQSLSGPSPTLSNSLFPRTRGHADKNLNWFKFGAIYCNNTRRYICMSLLEIGIFSLWV